MKFLAYLFIVSLLISCNSVDDQEDLILNRETMIGTWELKASYIDPGDGSGTYEPVPSGTTFTFKQDGSFYYERNTDCATGTFRVETNKVFFDYDCPDLNPDFATYEYDASFKGATLEFFPIAPYVCIEGCGEKFRKK